MEPVNEATTARLDVGVVLRRAYSTLMKEPFIFFIVAAAATLLTAIMELALSRSWGADCFVIGVSFAGTLLAQGAIASGVFFILRHETARFHKCFKRIPVLLSLALLGVLVLGACKPLFMACVMVFGVVITYVLLFVAAIAWCYLYVIFAVFVPVCIMERLNLVDCCKRSAELTKGFRLKILILAVVTGLAALCILLGVEQICEILSINAATSKIITSLVAAAPQAFSAVMLTVTYFELRLIKEGVTPESVG